MNTPLLDRSVALAHPLAEPRPRAAASAGRRVASAGRTRWRACCYLLLPMLLLVSSAYWFAPTDVDYWWHARTGQLTLETGLPRTDVFSYMSADQPWVTHEWLTNVLFYIVEQHVGYAGNVALFSLAGMLTAVAVYATCRLWGLGEIGSVILMLYAFMMGVGSLQSVRPQGLTALCFAVTVLLVTRYRHGHTRSIWLLPPLMALWVNLHGGYVIGLFVLGLTVVGEAAERLRGRGVPLRPLIAVTVLSALATLLNPHGPEALLYPFSFAGTSNASMQFISEWQSPNFHLKYFYTFGSALLLVGALGTGQRPLRFTDVLWVAGFSYLALQSIRHIPLFAIVVTPLLGARLLALVPALGRGLAAWRRPALLAVAWPLMLLGVLVVVGGSTQQGSVPQVGRTASAVEFPAGAVDYLREHGLRGRIMNEYSWAGYLLYQLYPEHTMFVDAMAVVNEDGAMRQYTDLLQLKTGWRDTLDRNGIAVVLLRKDEVLARVLADDPTWIEVYSGPVERLFLRRPAS